VHDTNAWWPSNFYFTQGNSSFHIEAKAGGRVYELSDEGSELLWGTVLAIEPNKAMNWCAPFSPPYAGPGTSFIRFALEDTDDGGTTFTLTQHYIGTPVEGHKEQMEEGWELLFDQALRAYVEAL